MSWVVLYQEILSPPSLPPPLPPPPPPSLPPPHSLLSQGLLSRGQHSYNGSGAERSISPVKVPSLFVNDSEKATITKASSQYLDTSTIPPQACATRPMSAPGFLSHQMFEYCHQQNGLLSSEWHRHETTQDSTREERKHPLATSHQSTEARGVVMCPNCAVMFPRRPELFQKWFDHIESCSL